MHITPSEILTPPAPLDSTVLHSPDEVRAFKRALVDYGNALAEEARIERLKQQAAEAKARAPLTPEERYALALKREQQKQAAEAAIAKRETEKAAAEEAFLASSPASVEICEPSPAVFLKKVVHWATRGYELNEYSIAIDPLCVATFTAPAPATPVKKAK